VVSDSSAGASRGRSIRQIQRETAPHFTPIKKILAQSSPPESQCPDRPQPKIGPHLERIREILETDEILPKKQRHTARRILERIREEGCLGSHSQVKKAVRGNAGRPLRHVLELPHRSGPAFPGALRP